ncbi:MAG: hypothetical protein WDK96_01770 [Candidatus Paceibacterota bacterium]|jgi:hypothetical protein
MKKLVVILILLVSTNSLNAQWGNLTDSLRTAYQKETHKLVIKIVDTFEVKYYYPAMALDTSFATDTSLTNDSIFGFCRATSEENTSKKSVEISLLTVPGYTADLTKAVIKAKQLGYRPATIEELLLIKDKDLLSVDKNMEIILAPMSGAAKISNEEEDRGQTIYGILCLKLNPATKKFYVDIKEGCGFYIFPEVAICVVKEL